jgi:hypothetical protein
MRLFIKPYSNDQIGDNGTSFQDYREIEDLQILRSIKKNEEITLYFDRAWTVIGRKYYLSLIAGKPLPLFKKIWNKDDYLTFNGFDEPEKTSLIVYSVDPIDDFRFYIEYFVEDALEDDHMFRYIYHALTFLNRKTPWEKDFRKGLFLSIIPTIETTPVLIVKQDNDGTTFIISPIEVEYLNSLSNITYI